MAAVLYTHVCEHCRSLIESGRWSAGEKLPSERTLCEQFGVTRMTIRQALQTLESEGRLYRENRRGWFVSPPAVRYSPAERLSFNRYVAQQGFLPRTEKLTQALVPAPDWVAQRMGLNESDSVLYLLRRRFVNDRAVLVEEIHINTAILPALVNEDLAHSLTELVWAKHQVRYDNMDLLISAAALPPNAAQLLGTSAGHPGLQIERVNYSADGVVMEIDQEYWRHDSVTTQISVRSS